MLPPADADDDVDDGGGFTVVDRETLNFGAVADVDVAGGLDEGPGVVTDDDTTGVDGAPAPVPCPGEDVLHEASATAPTSAAAMVCLRCTGSPPESVSGPEITAGRSRIG